MLQFRPSQITLFITLTFFIYDEEYCPLIDAGMPNENMNGRSVTLDQRDKKAGVRCSCFYYYIFLATILQLPAYFITP